MDIPFYKRILFRAMSKDFLLPHNFLENELLKMTVAQQILQPIRLCVRNTHSPVGNMHFPPKASIHHYGALPTAVLAKTYSGVYQLKYEPT